ncbi:MAG TPA: hypothetical protein VKE69_01235 [Planctomycetota bacterium]|nr:hypothetical protein [Planctomycetota bacterium]
MPGGPLPLALAYVGGVKLLGYSGFAVLANRRFREPKRNPFVVGATRTAIGLVAGIAVATLVIDRLHSPIPFFLTLVPVRVAEWLLVFWLFYRPALANTPKLGWFVALAVAVSFLLDAPAIFAVVMLPGGLWVC